MNSKALIRESIPEDLESIITVERAAFRSNEEASLVCDILDDPSAEPILSLLAFEAEKPVGHIIFSRANFDPPLAVQGRILGPLAVIPSRQKSGIGSLLVEKGIAILVDRGVDWVFVLGHESYYPRFKFSPAIPQGFHPPYPIPGEFTNAWMAKSLTPTCIVPYKGKVIPAESFNAPRYWGE